MPVKVYDLAKELNLSNTETLTLLDRMGLKRMSPSSDLDDDTARRVRTAVAGARNGAGRPSHGASNGASSNGARPAAAPPPVAQAAPPAGETVDVPVNVTVKDLAERLGMSASELQKVLMGMGVLAALNQRLAPDAVNRIAQKLGRTVRIGTPAPATPAPVASPAATGVEKAPVATGKAPTAPKAGGSKALAVQGRKVQEVARPPVVTIMGHVDHGKTSLLDSIRKADVASREAGGITQHIGAYQIDRDGQRITFIDTPGHAAFSSMRSRGASVTDIVIIVIAANDSIMPQTQEAIKIARDAGVPIIVAINKIDLPDSNPDQVMIDLTSHELVPEAYGGDVQTVPISAKTGQGIDDLLDTILLVSEAIVDPKADPHAKAQGTVIEAKLEKGRGPVISVLVQQGTLTQGDAVVAGASFGKIRTMTDDRGNKLSKAGPSTPVEIVGLDAVPEPGDRLEVAKDEREARRLAEERGETIRNLRLQSGGRMTLEALYKQLLSGGTKELNLVIKGDVQGSVQAVRDAVANLGNDEVRVRILSTGVGAISESDVLLAASDKDQDEKNSLVVGFNVGTANGVDKKAEQEHVRIRTFNIIYQLIDAVKEDLVALMEPIYEEATLGKAEVRALFRLPGGRSIAGSYVTDGQIRRNARARVFRGKDLLTTGDIETLKRFRDDVREVTFGYECGLTVSDFNQFEVGDVIECFEMRQVPREL
ncbi:MAG: translation initiation factor IF-2 [Capsulimonadales bacterium]|nr:translation initiation factor IF-2 [Capsulimonadales bacterium]